MTGQIPLSSNSQKNRLEYKSALFRSVVLTAAALAAAHAGAQISVSDSGAPSFSQTIAVPPGVGGMAPKLGLSLGGAVNGPIGYGWSLQGISTVTRCPATIATDGRKTGVAFAPDDKLCLDGQRLIQVNNSGAALVGLGTNDAAGVASASYREYRTEIDSYALIRAYGYANGDTTGASGPAYFKVWTKSGQIIEYGDGPSKDANTKALISAMGSTKAMVWAIGRTSDVLGNYVDYKYEQRDVAWGSGPSGSALGHEWNLSEIQYSGNKVILAYADRASSSPQDAAEAYNLGYKNVSVRLLQSITTYINSPNTSALGPAASAVAAKTTKLTYDNGPVSKRSRLTSIQECAGGTGSTKCLPANKFAYAAGGSDAYTQSTAFNASTLQMLSTTGNYGTIMGDFNGDGTTDFIRWSDTPAQNQLWLSNGTGAFTQSTAFNLQGVNLFRSDGCYASIVTDVNGDGLPDFIRYSGPTSTSGAACATYGPTLVFINNGDGTFTQQNYSGPTLKRDLTANFYALDFDGDGKVDLVVALAGTYSGGGVGACQKTGNCEPPAYNCTNASGVCTHVYHGNGDGSFTEVATNIAANAYYDSPARNPDLNNTARISDLDGDGLSDFGGYLYSGSLYIDSLRSRGDGNFDVYTGKACASPIDFNGDGRADCLGLYLPASLALAGGTAVSGFNLTQTGQELTGTGVGVVVADVNGDGRQDIIRWKDTASQNVVYLSNGDGTFTASTSFNLAGVQLKKSDGTADFATGDFTGHGNVEILRMQTVSGVTTNVLYVKSNSTPPDQLVSFTSSNGATSSIYYVPLAVPLTSNSPNAAALGPRYFGDRGTANAATLPTVDLTPPMYVVASVVTSAAIGGYTIAAEYSYAGLKADARGRGLLGFREVRRQAPGPDGSPLTTVKQFLQSQPYIGATANVAVYNAALNAVSASSNIGTTANVYCDQTAAPGADATALSTKVACPSTAVIRRPYLLFSTLTGQDLTGVALPTVTTQTAVNATGDPTSVVTTTSGSVANVAQTFVSSTSNLYQPDVTTCTDPATCKWILGRLQQSTVSSSVPNSLPSIATSAGTSANATATAGSTPPGQSWPLSPAQLAVIIQFLLSD